MNSRFKSFVERRYRSLLRLYPADFNRHYGDDMAQLFGDRLREAPPGLLSSFLCCSRSFLDLLWQAWRERLHQWRGRRKGGETPLPTGGDPGSPPDRPGRLRSFVEGWRQDLLFAVKTLRRAPAFTLLALFTLALGIGATATLFNLVYGVLLRPLAFGSADELVTIWESQPQQGVLASETSMALFLDWREQNGTLADVTASMAAPFVLQDQAPDDTAAAADREAIAVDGAYVYPNFFSVLDFDPALGRRLDWQDTTPGRRGDALVISHDLFMERWGGDPEIIGQQIWLDGSPITIVGVVGDNVSAPFDRVDLWVAAGFVRPESRWNRHSRRLEVFARLASGVSVEEAQADLGRLSALLQEGDLADIYEGWEARVVPLVEQITGGARRTLLLAFIAVGLVLLIACTNVANMLLTRMASRRREMALRTALGAKRGRLLRQVFLEGLLLALLAAVVGMGLTGVAHNLVLAFEPDILPRAAELTIAPETFLFAVGLSLLTALLSSLVPAFEISGAQPQLSLKDGGRSTTHGPGGQRFRGGLVAAQLCLATILLSGAGLLTRTLIELHQVDPGFEPDGALAARVSLDGRRYNSDEQRAQYFAALEERLKALPGVEAVGATAALPMDPLGINYDLPYRLEGDDESLSDNELPQADFRAVTPGYFKSLETPLLRGRGIREEDRPDTTFVVVINKTLADRAWPHENPLGKRLYTPSTTWHWFEVVGVVADTRYYGLARAAKPEMYMAMAQVPQASMTVVVRVAADAEALLEPVRREILLQDSSQPARSIALLSDLVENDVRFERFMTLILGVVASLALVLSAIGVYGTLSYWVVQRRHEIGIRMALGASRQRMLQRVVGRGLLLAGAGVALGLLVALVSNQLLTGALYGIEPDDPLTLVAVASALLATALLACSLPAFRASRVDPVHTLRDD